MTAENFYLRPGTVVRHVRSEHRWGYILSADAQNRRFLVRWRDGEEEDRIRHNQLIRAAAPCGACGERADQHKPGDDHKFTQETP